MTGKSKGGPFVGAALICEKVLKETDGVASFIRVVDRINVQGPTDELPPNMVIPLALVLNLKVGDARGKHKVTFRPETPSGQTLPEVSLQVLFEGDGDRGVNVNLNYGLKVEHEGLHWFDVFVDSEMITRIPLRIIYRKIEPNVRPG